MKLYKLRFVQSDFTSKEGNLWRTGAIDLYNNAQYKNYSLRRAPYGTDLLGNGVYTGLNSADGINSEIGFVENDRFIDTSGRIDVIEWKINFQHPDNVPVNVVLNVYSTEEPGLTPYYTHATPSLVDDWAIVRNLSPGEPIYNLNAYRYCFFELELLSDAPVDPEAIVELVVAVEIQPPVVNGFFRGTRRVLDRFPEWMEMREHDPLDPNDANKATPNSLGGQFINAAAGEWLTDIRGKISYQEFQKHIESVDTDQRAWVWRVSNVPDDIFSITGYDTVLDTDIQLTYISSLDEFYNCRNDEDAFFYNPSKNEVYLLQEYALGFKVNGEVYPKPELFHIWNALDDLGASVDLFRLYNEGNDFFKKRILDVYRSDPGVSIERFQKTLRREFSLWQFYGATPDSDYVGATPDVLEIGDIERDPKYFNPDGTATEAFYGLVQKLGEKYPMTWGLFNYGEALWDADGLYHMGHKTIPKKFDTATPADALYQSGVGDLNDLYVLPPNFYEPEQEFDVTLAVRGRRPTASSKATEIPIAFSLTGVATRTTAVYESASYPFHIEIDYGGITYVANADLASNYFGGNPDDIGLNFYDPAGTWPPPAVDSQAKSIFDWYSPGGLTADFLGWYIKSSGELSGTQQWDTAGITAVRIRPGEWLPTSQSITNVPDSDYYQVQFVDPGLTGNLGYSGSSPLAETSPDFVGEDLRLEYQVWDFSVTEDDPEGFKSIPQYVEVVVNAGDTLNPATISVANFDWPEYVGPGTEVHKVQVEILEKNDLDDFGAFTRLGTFVDASSISLNGSTAWSGGLLEITLGSPLSQGESYDITVSCTTGSGYPESVENWDTFYETQTVSLTDNQVNSNGAYFNGEAPRTGSNNYVIFSDILTRADFSLQAGDIPTWIGVDAVTNPNVTVWTSTNTIVPSGEVLENYPAGALQEDNSSLGQLTVYGKLKPNINYSWNPYIHSGWFHENNKDYYLYAQAESATIDSGSTLSMPSQPQQGAPVKVVDNTGQDYRMVPVYDQATPFQVVEIKTGNGTDTLYASYANITGIVVRNLNTLSEETLINTTSISNEVQLDTVTSWDHEYELTYSLETAFAIDNLSTPGTSNLFVSEDGDYTVTWESSEFNPATPLSLPLHPLYSSFNEGFIYIDHDEKDLDQVEVLVSPSHMLATPGEYALVTIKAYDTHGNPKPNVLFRISQSGGVVLSVPEVQTDDFGYATLYIDADTSSTSGTITVIGSQDTTFGQFGALWNADQGTSSIIPNLGSTAGLNLNVSGLVRVQSPSIWLPTEAGSLETNVRIPNCNKFELWMRLTLEASSKDQVLAGYTSSAGGHAGVTVSRNASDEISVTFGDGGGIYVNNSLNGTPSFGPGERFWLRVVVDTDGNSTIAEHRDQPIKPVDSSGGWTILSLDDTSSSGAIAEPNDNIIIGSGPNQEDTLEASGIHAWEIRADGQLITGLTSASLEQLDRGAITFQDTSGATITLADDGGSTVPVIVTRGVEYINPDYTDTHMANVTDANAFDVGADEDIVLVWVGKIGAVNSFNSRLLTVANNGAASIELIRDDVDETVDFRFDNGSSDISLTSTEDIDARKAVVIVGALNVADENIELHWYYEDGTGGYASQSVSGPFNVINLNGQARVMRNTSGAFIAAGVNIGSGVAPTQAQAALIARKIFDSKHVIVNEKTFEVRPTAYQRTRVSAVLDASEILAGGETGTSILGIVTDVNDAPVSGAFVFWRKARDIETLFTDITQSSSTAAPGASNTAGRVTTDSDGRFNVGPFVSDDEPGYWFVAVECEDGGDVVYWYEYLNSTNILDSVTSQPFFSVQEGLSSDSFVDYYATPAFPVTFDEENYIAPATGHTPEWSPPAWYPVKRYTQYQMGLLGNSHYDFDKSATPDYDDSVQA